MKVYTVVVMKLSAQFSNRFIRINMSFPLIFPLTIKNKYLLLYRFIAFFITGDITSFFINVEENDKYTLVECTLCNKTIRKFKRRGNFHLKQHYESVHIGGNEVKCSICKQILKNKNCLFAHISRKHKK